MRERGEGQGRGHAGELRSCGGRPPPPPPRAPLVQVRGLPFSTAFEYSIYTSSFVLVKGFGEVEVPEAAEEVPGAARHDPAAAVAEAAEAVGVEEAQPQRRQLLSGTATATATTRTTTATQADRGNSPVAKMTRCPFESSPLPLDGPALASDPAMTSVLVHEATANCLLWGLHRAGKLTFSLRDGSVPGLSITTVGGGGGGGGGGGEARVASWVGSTGG